MPTWVYEARDAAGKAVRGAHEAADRSAALQFLRAQGLFLTRLEASGRAAPSASSNSAPLPNSAPRDEETTSHRALPNSESTKNDALRASGPRSSAVPALPIAVSTAGNPALQNPRSTSAPIAPQPLLRASSKDLSTYFRQCGAMIHAGTTLGAALHSMGEHAPNSALRSASTQMEARVMSGETLSDSMRAFPGLFTPLHLGMVTAGERGGFLEEMFARLAKYSERDYDLQQTIKRETWYPKLLIFASILIPSAVPLVLAMVQKTGNPFLAWLSQVWAPFFVIGSAVFIYRAVNFASPLAAHYSAPKLLLDNFKLKVPIGGKVVRGLATAKFCRALGALYSAGVGPGESVRLAAAACGNAAIAQSAIGIVPRLEHGEKLTTSLASTGHFPSSVMQVMAVGEESGSLDEQLDKAADFLESDAEVAVKQSVQVFSILIFLAIAIYIALQVAQFYLGYFNSVMDEGEKMAQ
ncbi:Type II secretory pathway, component PulF [Abditibacterium utsteinense]|uniref:Type II secretory pathway, component PulF n=1 Tax=Abditibacterium utsteinense TaxID=1960156 RepID=A0A2S8STX2_9BACT|nr:type II secretion system F family protein [Abditibacterium utsteinense]PQV64247.1 Type II secretory pathway, component PulF [Abditibacterium utsteinense]